MSEHVIELKPRPRDRVRVTLSGGRFFTIPEEEARGLRVDALLSADEVLRFDRMDQYFRGKDKALRLLSLRSRTKAEIETALALLEIEKTIRAGIISELEETGFVDDRRFSAEYVRTKMDVRGLGPYRLRHELKKKGVSRAIVDETLDKAFDEGTQEEMARRLAGKKAGSAVVDESAARRIAGFLRRKGFDYDVVNRVVYDLLRGHKP